MTAFWAAQASDTLDRTWTLLCFGPTVTSVEYRKIPFSVTGRIDNPKTDLLDKLIGANVGQDVGGMLVNILRSSVP